MQVTLHVSTFPTAPVRKDREKMEENKKEQLFKACTPEQREALTNALQDPEKRKAIIAILKDAGLLRE